ncbi:hypothetical protein [Rufibacter latericius]|uniref:Uncharacterized protein n=1 Tax=Rufibacter latericius TaxID=2487040 RepID=A0A3M9MST5_9BACT|nr:hypothetical protein [Rufibacter latericius]RNI28584.1 hypothetical protein EFB08_08060 [Rufibacter latericius]
MPKTVDIFQRQPTNGCLFLAVLLPVLFMTRHYTAGSDYTNWITLAVWAYFAKMALKPTLPA